MRIVVTLLIIGLPVTPLIPSVVATDMVVQASPNQQEKKSDDIIYEAGKETPFPTLIKRVEPEYPAQARQHGVDDFVLLQAVIDKKGHVRSVNVIQAPPKKYGFGEAAVNALKQWEFKPTIYKGKEVSVRIRLSVEFNFAEHERKEKQSQEKKIYDIKEYNIPEPEAVNRVVPNYPEEGLKNRIPGAYVILEVVVDKEGYVREAHVVRIMSLQHSKILKKKIGSDDDYKAMVAASSHEFEDTYGFGREVANAIIQWQFEPSLYDGEIISIRMLVGIEFTITHPNPPIRQD